MPTGKGEDNRRKQKKKSSALHFAATAFPGLFCPFPLWALAAWNILEFVGSSGQPQRRGSEAPVRVVCGKAVVPGDRPNGRRSLGTNLDE